MEHLTTILACLAILAATGILLVKLGIFGRGVPPCRG